jgi:cytochrome c oxidase subunit 2
MPLFCKSKHWLAGVTGVILASLLLTACGENNNASILNTAGPVATRESDLFYVILAIATVIFVGVEAALIWSIVRYRERPGMPAPRQLHGNLRVEALWTIIPAIVLFIVLFFTLRTLFAVAAPPANAGKVIKVQAVGHQWWWEFYYPEYNITTADTLYVPAGTVVDVQLFSNNVIHSFWIPQLTGKTDVIPGHNNHRWFSADSNAVGRYFIGECAEYCGTQHAHMAFNVYVDSSNGFQTWVSTQQQSAVVPASGSLAAQGAKIFQGQCTTCHGIVGQGNGYVSGYYNPITYCNNAKAQNTDAERCKVGPNLTHFGSRNIIAGGVLTNDPAACTPAPYKQLIKTCNLAKWLADPQGIKPGNDMQVSLTPDQVTALVAYLESLK